MNNATTSLKSLEQLLGRLEPEFVGSLIAVVWRFIAAVHSFFQINRHTSRLQSA